jgi:hypothetical protein
MRTGLWKLTGAVVLAVAAWAAWREAGLTARVADAKERLATLQLGVDDTLQPEATLSDLAPGGARSLSDEIRGDRATVAYWLSRYAEVMDVGRGELDPALLRLAADAAFRESQRAGGVGGPEAVQRLDGVLQAYAAVLKAAPTDADAAYNYEFVARVREQVAKMPAPKLVKGAPPKEEPAPAQVVTVRQGDLPAGPTVHGRPGAPPADAKTEKFEILAPMEFGDREAQPQATPGGKLPRKG